MTLVKRRIYNESPFGPTTIPASPSATAITVHTAPHSNQDTFLRARFEFQMATQVGSPTADVPPEDWWPRASLTLIASWSPTGSHSPLPLVGNSEHYLGSQILVPRLTHSPSDPTEYVVQWSQEEPMILDTARQDATATTAPTIIVGFHVNDPDNALDGTYSAISTTWYWRMFSLWGSTT